MLPGLDLQPTEELIQKKRADKAGKAYATEATSGLDFHPSPNFHSYVKHDTALHKQTFKPLYKHGQVKTCVTPNANLCFVL